MAHYALIGTVPTDTTPANAWATIVDAFRTGATSVEVVERSVGGNDIFELRAWIGRRHDGSNKKSFPAGQDPHCPECPEKTG